MQRIPPQPHGAFNPGPRNRSFQEGFALPMPRRLPLTDDFAGLRDWFPPGGKSQRGDFFMVGWGVIVNKRKKKEEEEVEEIRMDGSCTDARGPFASAQGVGVAQVQGVLSHPKCRAILRHARKRPTTVVEVAVGMADYLGIRPQLETVKHDSRQPLSSLVASA